MQHLRIALALVILVSCKAAGSWNFGTGTSPASASPRGSAPATNDGAVAATDTRQRDADLDAVGDSIERADAWFQRYATAEIKAACGIDVALTIDFKSFAGAPHDEPRHIIGTTYCGQIPVTLTNVCADDVGRTAVRELRAVHCERLIGKATKGGAKIFKSDGNKHAYDYQNGKLTLKLGGYETSELFFPGAIARVMWPVVRWQRDVDAWLGYLNKHFVNWSEDKDGVEFTVDIDRKGFATVNYMWAFLACGGDGNTNAEGYGRAYPNGGALHEFLELLWATDKGKQILRKVKRVTCSATPDPKGRTPELVGDQLIFYGRVLADHHYASTVTGFSPNRVPQHDAKYAYGLFRKAHKLGGDCPFSSYESDPERDLVCPRK